MSIHLETAPSLSRTEAVDNQVSQTNQTEAKLPNMNLGEFYLNQMTEVY